MTVDWVESGDGTGYLRFQSSNYGSASSVDVNTSVANSAVNVLGLANPILEEGKDVAGTINGEEATDLVEGVEGTVAVANGIAARLVNMVDTLSQAGSGMLDRRIKGVEDQIKDLNDQITAFDARLAQRRERLVSQYYAMEQALAQMGSVGNYLTNNLANLDSQWKFNQ